MAYDTNNVFAKILRGEIPSVKVFEDEKTLAFMDVMPQTDGHVLVIPKGAYISLDDFSARGSDTEIAALFRALGTIARQLGLSESGYRFLANNGVNAHQEVPHFHVHLFGGRKMGPMLVKEPRTAE